jgi:SAM-dependent methyltransferase
MKFLQKPEVRRAIRSVIKTGTKNEQWARVVMNQETRKLIDNLGPSSLKVLEISGNAWNKRMDFKDYKSLQYPEFDITTSTLNERFDLIIAEQVFEHLLWPYRAGKNVYTMLNPGGNFLITTPFLVKIHNAPVDCSRWTETGLKYFLAECGFDLNSIQTASWGNRACVKANLFRWWEYRKHFHSLHNEPDFPVIVWALANRQR